jgi:4-methylaminobutanoate oxidase (formaldehyde-forming)
MIDGQPSIDLWSVDVRRFDRASNNLRFLRERVTEVLGLHYQTAWPNRELESARGLKQSPLHEHLEAAGAWFGIKSGWERPNWFTLDRSKPGMEYSFGKQNWFENHRREHLAAREDAAIFDQTSFGKILIQGPDAVSFLQRLGGNNLDCAVGRIVYTGMFNSRGGFESDCAILRLGTDQYLQITGTSQPKRDLDWLASNRRASERLELADITNAWSVIGVMGPKSRELLQSLSDADLGNDAFPFGTFQEIGIGYATVRAVRITYVGELGWELHVPMNQAAQVYDALVSAGARFGLANAGHYAINSLRLEKGYRAWGAELSPDDSPLEAGLSFAIDWEKDFIGREALSRQKSGKLQRRLFVFTLNNPDEMLWGSEPIYMNGQPVGYTTSGSYGHSLEAAVAMGYINADIEWKTVPSQEVAIGVNGKRIPARAFLKPPYDPDRKKILR